MIKKVTLRSSGLAIPLDDLFAVVNDAYSAWDDGEMPARSEPVLQACCAYVEAMRDNRQAFKGGDRVRRCDGDALAHDAIRDMRGTVAEAIPSKGRVLVLWDTDARGGLLHHCVHSYDALEITCDHMAPHGHWCCGGMPSTRANVSGGKS